jgi:hypothetical protein
MASFDIHIKLGPDDDLNTIASYLANVRASLLNDQEEDGTIFSPAGDDIGFWQIDEDDEEDS